MSASTVFADALASLVNQPDVESMIQAQKHMMCRFEKTNEMLINCNALSTVRLHSASQDFKHHTQLLLEMKRDLDAIYKRIRTMKAKLAQQYPEAFKACRSEVPEDEATLSSEAAADCCVVVSGSCSDEKVVETQEDVEEEEEEDNILKMPSNRSSSCSSTPVSPAQSASSSDS